MDINNYILQILKLLTLVGNPYQLKLGDKDFVEITENSININGQNFEGKILCPNIQFSNTVDLNIVSSFISNISEKITRINHLGISYSCRSIDRELTFYKKLISGTNLKLFEEESGSKLSRWFFIGNIKNDKPLFEIVLTESNAPIINDWVPHFQIDFNTTMNYEEIIKSTKSQLAKDFIKWKLDIPNHGIVLAMGILGNINGTKITLGIGTNLRGKQTLKEISN